MEPESAHIRQMAQRDVAAVSELLPHLGYSGTPSEVAARFSAMLEWPDNVAFVVESRGIVAGLCQVHGVRLLASDGYAEIAALVVHTEHQRQGIGRALVRQATAWAMARGYERVRLRSGLHREEAHQFYVSLGFSKSRASYAFERTFSKNAA